MKVRALKDFRDKYTKELYKKGSVFEVPAERAEEMNSSLAAPLVEEVKTRGKKKEG